MGIVLRNKDERSELQERVAAELREKINSTQGLEPDKKLKEKAEMPDFVKDSEYVRDYQKKPMKNGRVVGIIVACVVVLFLVGLIIVIS